LGRRSLLQACFGRGGTGSTTVQPACAAVAIST
jgi:hypothetical protein